ncbi:hypothetical protein EV368DRAFT_67026 [Lentinula lateritia]|uniref:Uncharacterized protein n=1 Tax=Lentinula aff. lateritia TaxID=2804960 RepID=A0ACC1TTM3_9AGAR|nr:hypothetical protein F5876DRAFT_67557 [Lentinula aff. lateritia]KAJ3849938.1 hypothetical protein EV368DRAFT_67026 [Lentinula lateritia]
MVFLNTKLTTGISFIVVYLTAIPTPVVQGLPATEPRTQADHLVCGLDAAPYCPSGYVCCGPYFEPINGGNGTAYGSIEMSNLKWAVISREMINYSASYEKE